MVHINEKSDHAVNAPQKAKNCLGFSSKPLACGVCSINYSNSLYFDLKDELLKEVWGYFEVNFPHSVSQRTHLNRGGWMENVYASDPSKSLNITLTDSSVSASVCSELDLMYIITTRLTQFTFALGSFTGLEVTCGGVWPLQLMYRSNKKGGKSMHPLASSHPKYRLHKYLCHDTMNDRWFSDAGVRGISAGPSRPSCLLQPPQSDSMGLRRDLNPHLWLGYAFGCPAGGTCPHYLLRQTSERHADRTPEPPQRAPFNVEKQ